MLAGSKTRKVKVHVCVGKENRYSNPNGETLSNFRTFYVLNVRKYVRQFLYLACCGKLYLKGLQIILCISKSYITETNSSGNARFNMFRVA